MVVRRITSSSKTARRANANHCRDYRHIQPKTRVKGNVYFEKQVRGMCVLHAVNNVFVEYFGAFFGGKRSTSASLISFTNPVHSISPEAVRKDLNTYLNARKLFLNLVEK
jgi:hypothetical protein